MVCGHERVKMDLGLWLCVHVCASVCESVWAFEYVCVTV